MKDILQDAEISARLALDQYMADQTNEDAANNVAFWLVLGLEIAGNGQAVGKMEMSSALWWLTQRKTDFLEEGFDEATHYICNTHKGEREKAYKRVMRRYEK